MGMCYVGNTDAIHGWMAWHLATPCGEHIVKMKEVYSLTYPIQILSLSLSLTLSLSPSLSLSLSHSLSLSFFSLRKQ